MWVLSIAPTTLEVAFFSVNDTITENVFAVNHIQVLIKMCPRKEHDESVNGES